MGVLGRTVAPIGREVSPSERCGGVPIWVDARLPDGSATHEPRTPASHSQGRARRG